MGRQNAPFEQVERRGNKKRERSGARPGRSRWPSTPSEAAQDAPGRLRERVQMQHPPGWRPMRYENASAAEVARTGGGASRKASFVWGGPAPWGGG